MYVKYEDDDSTKNNSSDAENESLFVRLHLLVVVDVLVSVLYFIHFPSRRFS